MNYRLVLSDVDSTLIDAEVIDLLANLAGVGNAVVSITERAMSGELDFESALRERVALLAGLSSSAFQEVASVVRFAPGAAELMSFCAERDIRFGVVSGGFHQVLSELALDKRAIFIRANTLEIADEKLTGRLTGPIIDRAAKAQALRDFANSEGVDLAHTVAIGDGANDIDMVELAGLGVAFRGKRALAEVADLRLDSSLVELLPYL